MNAVHGVLRVNRAAAATAQAMHARAQSPQHGHPGMQPEPLETPAEMLHTPKEPAPRHTGGDRRRPRQPVVQRTATAVLRCGAVLQCGVWESWWAGGARTASCAAAAATRCASCSSSRACSELTTSTGATMRDASTGWPPTRSMLSDRSTASRDATAEMSMMAARPAGRLGLAADEPCSGAGVVTARVHDRCWPRQARGV